MGREAKLSESLAERVRRGDRAAFGVFVGRYLAGAWSVAVRWPVGSPEQVVQRAFSELHRGPDPVVSLFSALLKGCRQGTGASPRDALGEDLARLPEEQREVLLLVDVAGLQISAAANILGLPTSSAAARLHRAREALGEGRG